MIKFLALLMVLVFSLLHSGCTGSKTPQGLSGSADLVLLNGNLLTLDQSLPRAQALAAIGDRIVRVGTNQEIEPLIGEHTQVINLEGQLTVPGLIDGHGHYMGLGESLMGIDLKAPRTWSEIVSIVATEVSRVDPGEWIVGRGWHQDKWEWPPTPNVEGSPVHDELSRVSPDNPVMLIHASGHGVFVNAKALEQVGITAATPDPPGGEIVRDGSGRATGMLRETAQDAVRDALARYQASLPPAEQEARLRRQVELAAAEAIANGVTSFHDMGETFEIIDLLKKMADEKALPLRLYVAIEEPAEKLAEHLARYKMVGYGGGYLTVRTIGEKVLDGALGTHGGWLLEPYADLPRSTGFNVVPVADIRRSAELAIEHGFQMAIQGIGDRAARELLNIYEENFRRHPTSGDLRWRIEHCQVIHPDDLPRFARLGVIASVRGIFATSDGPWVVKRLGEKRARERGYRYQSLFESGAIVINGTDPPVEDIDPIANFYSSVSRKMINGEVFFPDQRMTRLQALKSYTSNAAFAAFEEQHKGSLTPGKLADITVFTRDIMTLPEEEIRTAEVSYTIIGGQLKYRRE